MPLNEYEPQTIRDAALSAMGPLRQTANSASEAAAYALVCFHNPDDYWVEHTLRLLSAARSQLDRAEKLLRAAMPLASEPDAV